MLQNAGSVVDKTMEEIENIASRLAFDSQIKNFVNLEPLDTGSSKILSVRDAWTKLSDYKLQLTNNYIIDLAINSHSSGVTISSTIPYSKFPFFYGAMFQYGNMDYDQWKALFLDSYHNHEFLSASDVELMGIRHNAIVYLQSIPLGAMNRRRGTLFALIDAAQLKKLLEPLQYSPDSVVMVLDGNDKLLLNTNEAQNINLAQITETIKSDVAYKKLRMYNKDYLLTSYKSSFSKWTYVAIHPEDVISQKLFAWRRTMLFLVSGSFIVGILLVIYLSWRNANPINEIYQTIAGNDDIHPASSSRKSYDFLKGSIASLISDQHRLKEKMDQQLPLLQASYLKQLIGNEFISDAEMKAYAQNAGLEMEYDSYLCAIVSNYNIGQTDDPDQLQQMDIAMMLVQETILGKHRDSFILNRGTGQFVLIYCENTRDEAVLCQNFSDMIEQVITELQQKYNLPVRVDIGIPACKQTNCFQSYQSAMSAGEYREGNCNSPVLWYKDVVMHQESYRFPVETEIQLVNHIKEGKTNNVVREINHLMAENFERRSLPTAKSHQLINMLLLIATRLNEDLEPALQIEITSPLLFTKTKEKICAHLVDLFVSLARQYEEAINGKQEKLKDRIVDYIERNYQDPNLTLYSAATEFCMTESVVYIFIKKHLHMTFADYLENIRIRNACLLLMGSEENINDIAEKAGYTSPHSFRRAFKRIKGVTPTLYKELMKDSIALSNDNPKEM